MISHAFKKTIVLHLKHQGGLDQLYIATIFSDRLINQQLTLTSI
jgi:hypothetical protein